MFVFFELNSLSLSLPHFSLSHLLFLFVFFTIVRVCVISHSAIVLYRYTHKTALANGLTDFPNGSAERTDSSTAILIRRTFESVFEQKDLNFKVNLLSSSVGEFSERV